MRLGRTAARAAESGCDAFSTTLLTSRHQDHELIRRVGVECQATHNVDFLYRDWRHMAEQNHEEASRMNLYLQQYCGCVFSESDRYRDTTRHLYRGGGS
jgi:hypothetical protein